MGGVWELPSGKADPGESLDVALIREVGEKTGLAASGIQNVIGQVPGSQLPDQLRDVQVPATGLGCRVV